MNIGMAWLGVVVKASEDIGVVARCESKGCRWRFAALNGARVPIAGCPGVTARVTGVEHAAVIARAHAWMHFIGRHRRAGDAE